MPSTAAPADAYDRSALLQAAIALLDCYQQLAVAGQHLLAPLLHDAAPKQWQHYPDSDVIDAASGYQYFYHSHSPEDCREAGEHGHFHLFVRVDGVSHTLDQQRERRFLSELGSAEGSGNAASLLCIGLDAKGVPISLFTVNRWVTGGYLLSAPATLALLKNFRIDTPGFERINQWLAATLGLFWPHIVELLQQRDQQLLALAQDRRGIPDLFDDESIEVLSSTTVDVDHQLTLLA